MSIDKRTDLLDGLQSLLEKQIELAQQGNISGVELLSKQAGSLAGRIVRAGILEQPEFKNRREQFKKLYGCLCLAVTAQRADVCEKLRRVRKGRKTIETYHKNI